MRLSRVKNLNLMKSNPETEESRKSRRARLHVASNV